MVIDTSALVAILLDEEERGAFVAAITADPRRLISAATLVETALVLEGRRGQVAGRELDLSLHRMRAEIIDVTEDQADLARSAWRRFGRGRHPAKLNFGDCFAYALARQENEPLLFKGRDFSQTDIEAVVAPGG